MSSRSPVLVSFAVLGVLVASCLVACKDKAPPAPEVVDLADAAVAVAPIDAKPAPPAPIQPWAAAGSCKLEVTGAAKHDQQDGQAAVLASWWFTDADRHVYPSTDAITINCSGGMVQLSVSSQQGVAVLGPKRYEVGKEARDLDIQGAIEGKSITSPTGSIELTSFDRKGMAGTIDLVGKLAPGDRKVTIKGSFEYRCPGYTGCEP